MVRGSYKETEYNSIAGLSLGSASAGIKTPDQQDLVVIKAVPGSNMVGVFTNNAFCAAPVQLCRHHLRQDQPLLLVINTGNANAGTGAQGNADALATCTQAAALTDLRVSQVLPFSTGVIGEQLPLDKLVAALPEALADLSNDGWSRAAKGILTTDTRSKGASVQWQWQGQTLNLTGIAKGAGMIRPNMATMLAFIATDASLDQACLQELLLHATEQSFNRITVDGDMSTNDSCILIATGASGVTVDTAQPELLASFNAALLQLMQQLAQAIVCDGEGATKFVIIEVVGGLSQTECLQVAYAIAHSQLVKTALFASDPNWGRILCAVGYAGVEKLDINRLTIHIGDTLLVTDGGRSPDYTEAAGQAVMEQDEVVIRVDLRRGLAKTTIWTTDLSYDYIRINAEYRT
jgi:glutamate N-acetyltransferase/amino-acid N-acetyltransferase